ncbi:MAG: hypothetical protein V1792_25435 [Pseudomonadota bacterium]
MNKTKEEDLAATPKSKSPRVKSDSRKRNPSQTRESVEAAIDGLDLAKFESKYPDLNVDDQFDRFREFFLDRNDSKTAQPNWKKWSDWNKAFHRWCATSLKWQQERTAKSEQTRTPDAGPQYQDLSNYKI